MREQTTRGAAPAGGGPIKRALAARRQLESRVTARRLQRLVRGPRSYLERVRDEGGRFSRRDDAGGSDG